MSKMISYLGKMLLVPGAMILVWLFLIPRIEPQEGTDVYARPEVNVGVQIDITYNEPPEVFRNAGGELVYHADLNITELGVMLNEANIWRTTGSDLVLELRLHHQGVDLYNTRLVLVFRGTQGDPWFVGDGFLCDPFILHTSPEKISPDQSIWYAINIDEQVLRNDPRNKPEWFREVEVSTVEIGVSDNTIAVTGPGPVPELDEPLTNLYPLVKHKFFQVIQP